jgi:hypothetical protein
LNEEDQIECEHKAIGCVIATLLGGGAISVLACGGLLVALAMESGESSPQEAREWFKTVVNAAPSSFTDIQHYTDQGIDFSHHFRFVFADVDELRPIIEYHGLTEAPNTLPMHMDHLPDWYDPFNVPADALRYGCDGYEPILLIVDTDAKIAYFEMVHL